MPRKNLLLICIIIIMVPGYNFAQRRRGMQYAIVTDIGFTGGAGVSMFGNEVMKNDGFIAYQKMAPDYSYGALGSISFMGNKPAFTVLTVSGEFISNTALPFINNINADGEQNYLYDKKIHYTSTDMLLLGKITYFFGKEAEKPVYLEGGIKISNLKDVKESNTIDHPDFYLNVNNYDPSQKYKNSYQSLVFGIGRYGDFVSVGLRCSYALEDITNGTDFMINDGVYNNTSLNTNYSSAYSEYKETSYFSIEFHLTLTLSILEIGKASCGSMFMRPLPCYKNCEYYW